MDFCYLDDLDLEPRDPDRIPEVLQALGEVWRLHPDWRLTQIVANACPLGKSIYNVEDDVVLRGLQEFLERDSDGEGQAQAST